MKTKIRTRKTKKVSTKPQRLAAAGLSVVLGFILLGLCASSIFADDKQNHFGVLFGTAYGPDDRPLYGVKVTIHPEGKKHPSWELYSDHHGEFAQHVPPGPADYVASGVVEVVPVENGKPQKSKKKRLTGEAKIHIAGEEWHDFSLHLQ
jgi:hypothetical protein